MKHVVLSGLALLFAPLALSACGEPSGGVEVSDAYIAAPLKGRDVTAGYFRLDNKGAAARLVGASSPVARRVEIHTHLHEDGVMKMRKVDGVDLAPGQTVVFEPGGYHLMMFGVTLEADTTEAPVTLQYEDGDEVSLVVPIRPRT